MRSNYLFAFCEAFPTAEANIFRHFRLRRKKRKGILSHAVCIKNLGRMVAPPPLRFPTIRKPASRLVKVGG